MAQTPENGNVEQPVQDPAPIGEVVLLNAADVSRAPVDGTVHPSVDTDANSRSVTSGEQPDAAAAAIPGTPEWHTAHTKLAFDVDVHGYAYFDLAPQFQGLSPAEVAERLRQARLFSDTAQNLSVAP